MRLTCQTLIVAALLALPCKAQYATALVPLGANEATSSLHLYFFDARQHSLVVIDQGRPAMQSYPNLAAAMKAFKCVAGCNGGRFDKEGNPIGLVVAEGREYGAINPAHGNGVLYVESGELRLQTTDQFLLRKSAQPDQFLQTGPFLVQNGAPLSTLDRRQVSRRTFLLTDGKHRWAIGISPGTTLLKLAQALAKDKIFGPEKFVVSTALALDGGLSSAIWIKQSQGPLYLTEGRPLRNFIGLVPKK